MTSIQINKNKRSFSANKDLIQAFKNFKKRYLIAGKKPNIKNILPEIVYRTMRLEDEKITRKEAQALFK